MKAGKNIKVGIIGGTGQMGQFFRKFFEENGYEVLISSRNTKLMPEDAARESDIAIISVPMDATMDAIRKIAPCMREGSVLMDTTSIKKEPVEAMIKYSNCEVIGMHPVFGPKVSSIRDQTVVLCLGRKGKWMDIIVRLLEKNGAKVKITTPEKHDEMMSIIQGLNHFSTLSVAHAMKSVGIGVAESLEYTSPIYKLRMAMVGRILSQDPHLYASIEMMNPGNKNVLEAYMDSSRKLQKIIIGKDKDAFLRYFNECSGFFAEFLKEGEELSDYLIEKIVEKDSQLINKNRKLQIYT